MNKEKMILGKDAIFSTDTTETQITNNVICVGSSGSGKTTSVIIPKLLETTESSHVTEDDIQAMLEAKFDELFGPLDDDDDCTCE